MIDVIDDIYDEYGMYLNKVENFTFEGASGMKAMADIMEDLRANPPLKIANLEVESILDYKDSTNRDVGSGKISKIDLPSSNVLSYSLPNGNGVIVRPSGTEPKIKVYITACAKNRDMAENLYKELAIDMKRFMKID